MVGVNRWHLTCACHLATFAPKNPRRVLAKVNAFELSPAESSFPFTGISDCLIFDFPM